MNDGTEGMLETALYEQAWFCNFFTRFHHPLRLLSCPQLMVKPTFWKRNWVSAAQFTLIKRTICSGNYGEVVASAHVLSPTALPHICAIERIKKEMRFP